MKRLLVLFILSGICGYGAVLTVASDGTGDYTSIQEAIYATWHGDRVEVRPGVYHEDIWYGGRGITVASVNPADPNVVAATIIDGTVSFNLGEQASSVLEGVTVRGRSYPLTEKQSEQGMSKIYGDIVVWADLRDYDSTGMDIYGINVATGVEFAICTADGNQIHPAVWGDVVVWQDYRSDPNFADVYGVNLTTMTEFAVSNGTWDESGPVIYNGVVVWQDNRTASAGYDIYGKTLAGGEEFIVSNASKDQLNPAISGAVVIWQDYRSGTNYDIYGRNIQLGSNFVICNVAKNQINPAISEQYYIWQDYRSGNADLYARNRSGGAEFVVNSLTSEQSYPSMDGATAVWKDYRNGNYDIYSKNLATSVESAICTDVNLQQQVAVSGQRFVWVDSRWGLPLVVYLDRARSQTSAIVCLGTSPQIRGNLIRTLDNGITGEYLATPAIVSNTILFGEVGISNCAGTIEENLIQLNGIGVSGCSGGIQTNFFTQNNMGLSDCNGEIWSNTISFNTTGMKSCSGQIADNTVSNNAGYGLNQCKGQIRDNRIMDNGLAGISGGGDAESVVTGNFVIHNAAGIAGLTAEVIRENVISLNVGDGLSNCTTEGIRNNIVAQNAGYGITGSTGMVTNNTVAANGNTGIKSSGAIKNNIVAYNAGYGIEGGQIAYNCLWQNTGGLYSGSVPGAGNVAVDPLFADKENGDYHLKSAVGRWDPETETWVVDEQTSLCIDGGDPADSTEQEPNPNGARINMGAFGGTSQASLSPNGNGTIVPLCITRPAMDFDGDCVVGLSDFAAFAAEWLACGLEPAEACGTGD
ncbi:MAG: right-handed parallel beta-helix repeat-containing protein [Anaerohalosphaeraceae bacterium]